MLLSACHSFVDAFGDLHSDSTPEPAVTKYIDISPVLVPRARSNYIYSNTIKFKALTDLYQHASIVQQRRCTKFPSIWSIPPFGGSLNLNQGACAALAVVVLSLRGILDPVESASLVGTWAP